MLTPHQERILKLKVAGKTNCEIAAATHSSRLTITSTFQKIFAKLGCEFSSSDNRAVRKLLIEKAYDDYIKKKSLQELSSTTSQVTESKEDKDLTEPPGGE